MSTTCMGKGDIEEVEEDENLATYLKLLQDKEWVERNKGRFVAIVNGEQVGIYNNRMELSESYAQYGTELFISEIGDDMGASLLTPFEVEVSSAGDEDFETARQELIVKLTEGKESLSTVPEIIEQVRQGTELGNEFVRLHIEIQKRLEKHRKSKRPLLRRLLDLLGK